MKRGEVHWADPVPRPGSEQTGRRPVIAISHDGFHQVPARRSIVVVPGSSKFRQVTAVYLPGALPYVTI